MFPYYVVISVIDLSGKYLQSTNSHSTLSDLLTTQLAVFAELEACVSSLRSFQVSRFS